MVSYDESVIVKMADTLYVEAQSLVIEQTGKAVVGGAVIGGGLGAVLARFQSGLPPGACVVLGATLIAALAGIAAYRNAERAAFELRFRAQQLLVLVAIERNTR